MTRAAIELITRAVIVRDDGALLVARRRGSDFVFLPGGHIEFGEPAEAALERELREELGSDVSVGDLVGVVEHLYTDSGQRHHELNLVFTAEITGPAVSREAHLEFLWVAAAEIAGADLRPHPVRDLVGTATPTPRWSGARQVPRPGSIFWMHSVMLCGEIFRRSDG